MKQRYRNDSTSSTKTKRKSGIVFCHHQHRILFKFKFYRFRIDKFRRAVHNNSIELFFNFHIFNLFSSFLCEKLALSECNAAVLCVTNAFTLCLLNLGRGCAWLPLRTVAKNIQYNQRERSTDNKVTTIVVGSDSRDKTFATASKADKKLSKFSVRQHSSARPGFVTCLS